MEESGVLQTLFDALKIGADEAAMPTVHALSEKAAKSIKALPIFIGFTRMVNPAFMAIARTTGPTILSGLIGKLIPGESPVEKIGKTAFTNFITKLAEKTDDKGNFTKEQADQVLDEVLGEVLKYDSRTRLVHRSDCPEVKRNFPDVKLAKVLEREMAVAVCCFPEMQHSLTQAEAKQSPKKDEPILGLADLYQRLPSDADRQIMRHWFATLNEEQLAKLSVHADLPSEGPFIVDCLKDGVPTEKILTLIEQQSSRTRLKNEICEGAKVVRDAGKDAIDYGWGKVEDAASPFADRVEQLNQSFVDLTQAPPPPKPSFFSWTGQKQFWGKDLWTIFKI